MSIVGLSEFAFGYAFLFEQTTKLWNGLKAAPILPRLSVEANLGWDAHLATATDFYYQFKLSDYLYRNNATFIRNNTYPAAYYRITLHSRENNLQHRRLKRLSLTHAETYYVAPEFRRVEDFNESFLAKEITQRSRLIPVADCDEVADTDGSTHYITYRQDEAGWIFHSDPRRHERSYSGKELEHVFERARPKLEPMGRPFAERLYVEAAQGARQVLSRESRTPAGASIPITDLPADEHTTKGFLQSAADIISVVYGATLVRVGTPAQP